MNTRKYTIIADNSTKFNNVMMSDDKKSFTVSFNNDTEISTHKVNVSDDELMIENVAISKDKLQLFANVLFEPTPNSQPLNIECNWSSLYRFPIMKTPSVMEYQHWCGTCNGL